ncbi:efflux RND transporter periplasmic adaptor subunit [Oxalobacteraceae bacterium CAVE-383]|nr:efflux RND transporter periplasmic adaptor subunit [Oxalobacteraceae bacterium CAVE-383]
MHSRTPFSRCTLPAAALLAVSLAGCGQSKTAAAPAPLPAVTVLTVRHTSVPAIVSLPGRTNAHLVAQVRARVDGVVQLLNYREGADVKAGQLLYKIDPAPYRAALNSARAALEKAGANLETTTAQADRYKILVAGNAVSKQTYDNAIAARDQAAADVAAAKAAVETATINLGYTDVVSPIAGRSNISQVTQGAYVQASAATLLTTVQQIDPMFVDLTESSVAGLQLRRQIASGQLQADGANAAEVKLTLEDGSSYPLPGKLQFSGITVDPATGSVTVRALFPNPKNILLPGMFVHASITQGVNANAFLIPAAAVTHDPQGQASVLVVGQDNKVAQRTVQAHDTFGTNWVVTGGLSDGERVVVAGAQKALPGTLVQAAEAAPAAPAAPAAAAASGPAPGVLAQASTPSNAK